MSQGITVTIIIRVHEAGGDLFMKRRLFIISFIGAFIIGFIIISFIRKGEAYTHELKNGLLVLAYIFA